MDLKLTECNF